MTKDRRRGRKPKPIVDGYDHVDVASIDSFPASDPPGWIEGAAHPCVDGDVQAGESCSKEAAKGPERAVAR